MRELYNFKELMALHRSGTPEALAEIEWQKKEWANRMMARISSLINLKE